MTQGDLVERVDDKPWPPGMEPEAGAPVRSTGQARFWLSSEGIIYNENLVEGRVEREHMERGMAAILELTGGKAAVVIAYGGKMTSSTREAREYMAGPESQRAMRAMGVIVTSSLVRVVMTFFLRWAKPPFETRLFSTMEEAKAWGRALAASEDHRASSGA